MWHKCMMFFHLVSFHIHTRNECELQFKNSPNPQITYLHVPKGHSTTTTLCVYGGLKKNKTAGAGSKFSSR